MPSNEEHSEDTFRRYGVRASDLHKWIDEPSELYGASHRWVRHNIRKLRSDPNYIPKEFVEKYGEELARNIMIDHILLDKHITGERPKLQPLAQQGIGLWVAAIGIILYLIIKVFVWMR